MTNTDYSGDIALLANSPAQAESLLHTLEQATGGISLGINSNQTEFLSFKQKKTFPF